MSERRELDWRDDASLPSRTHSWPIWMLAMALAGVGSAAIVVAVIGGVSSAGRSGCRVHEAREGIPDLEKIDVAVVGQQPARSWVPPVNVRVRYVKSDEAPTGTVIDETMCGQPEHQLLVTIAR